MAIRRFSTSNLSGTKSSKVWDQETFPGYFEAIATVLVPSGGVATVTFNNIPQIYTHLQLRMTVFNPIQWLGMRFNSDSGANYSYHIFRGNGASISAQAGSNATEMYQFALSGLSSSVPGAAIVDILDYRNTNKFKTIRSVNAVDQANGPTASDSTISISSGNWRNSIDPITTINIPYAFGQDSHIALYGIRSA